MYDIYILVYTYTLYPLHPRVHVYSAHNKYKRNIAWSTVLELFWLELFLPCSVFLICMPLLIDNLLPTTAFKSLPHFALGTLHFQ